MKSSLVFLATLALAVATPFSLDPRTAAQVLTDLKSVNTKTLAFNKSLSGISDSGTISGSQLVALDNQDAAIQTALKKATKDTNSSAAATVAQSKSIFTYVNGTLRTSTFTTLANVGAHKAAWDNSDVTSVIVGDLQDFKSAVAQLGNALIAKAAQPYKGEAPAVLQAYSNEFDAIIAQLNS